ncbi:hypothetical protein [Streptomyces sp. NBC_01794]|uniref:hypothetical protein n=1 Tax=Streptomyces sp. NBC_01794 TaxID=2975942 RepID=UPI003091615E|nr:hypothetical protein OIE54_09395 [Streptomyces sp. NBC_01794]
MHSSLEPAVGRAGELATKLFTTAELELLILQAGLSHFQPAPQAGKQRYAKTSLVASTLQAARKAVASSDSEDGLKEFLRLVAVRAMNQDFAWLQEAVRAAGFDLIADPGPVRLVPLEDPRAPLSEAATALEADFERLGWTTAKTLYQQAMQNLMDQRYETANGGMRSMFEEVIVQVAMRHGFVRPKQGAGGAALNYLIDQHSLLPTNDGGGYIRGLWKIVQTNGPHPGTSTAGEARFRVQAMTASARYLIDRFAPATP